ncbi:MaoC/PaaZ C-terminal domain-containing protein [Mycobacterium sp. SP-6446]|uniref:MaoC/PaaZ C-terminal domain-containing protein n=1 Tax=Mycobacterium sp. SP-6446 TaxID=1834162 RepID=UPI00096D662E|nr:MaoC/PaaZ C-terminal domain-containing protein [Mycobacterium sp. SP-6446]OMC10567.1 hypothetical protein A5736_00065 [Mycobacterium sp. SP-6446]
MSICRDAAVGVRWPEQDFHWSPDDVREYHRAVGWIDDRDNVLPTFAMTAPGMFGVVSPEFYRPRPPEVSFPGIRLNLASLLHRDQEIVVQRPLPPGGALRSAGQVVDVEDQVTAAVLVQRSTLVDTRGVPFVTGVSRIHARGDGGFDGAHDSRDSVMSGLVPEGRPIAVASTKTLAHQAIRYQRHVHGSAMRDNVHTDAAFARASGFPRPILQGVCTYGMVCAALVQTLLANNANQVSRYRARFLGVVFPGETLNTRVWESPQGYVFATSVPERKGTPVLHGILVTDQKRATVKTFGEH